MGWTIVPMSNPTPAPTGKYFDAGGSTLHTHTCPGEEGKPPHTWGCNSPYCANLNRQCPDHGGVEPVTIGLEPWRR